MKLSTFLAALNPFAFGEKIEKVVEHVERLERLVVSKTEAEAKAIKDAIVADLHPVTEAPAAPAPSSPSSSPAA